MQQINEAGSRGIYLTFFDSQDEAGSRVRLAEPMDHVVLRHKMILGDMSNGHGFSLLRPPGFEAGSDWSKAQFQLNGRAWSLAGGGEDHGARPDVRMDSGGKELWLRFYQFKGGEDQDPQPVLGPFSVIEKRGPVIRADGEVVGTDQAPFWAPVALATHQGGRFDIAVWTNTSKVNPTAFLDRDRLAQSQDTLIERMQERMRTRTPAESSADSPAPIPATIATQVVPLERSTPRPRPLTQTMGAGPKRSGESTLVRVYLGFLLIALLAGVATVFLGGKNSAGPIAGPIADSTAVASVSRPTATPKFLDIGEKGIAVTGKSSVSVVAFEDYERLQRAATAHDEVGFNEMFFDGRAFLIKPGTGLLVIDSKCTSGFLCGTLLYRVRVQDGSLAGMALWLLPQDVVRAQ